MADSNIHLDNLQLNIPNGFKIKPDFTELDPSGHIDEETYARIFATIDVNHPTDWMGENLEENPEIDPDSLPNEFKKIFEEFSDSEKLELQACANVLTEIANMNLDNLNEGQVNQLRKIYREAEMRIMYMVRVKIKEHLEIDVGNFEENKEKSFCLYALRGAKIMRNGFEPLAKYNYEVEMKRLVMSDGHFEVGVGYDFFSILKNISQEERDTIENVYLPDDCISTGMSQFAMLKLLKTLGLNKLKKIIIPASVAVSGGIKHLAQKARELFPECEIIIGAGEVAYQVNQLMYLLDQSKRFKVGDMGKFNDMDKCDYIPEGDQPIDANNLIAQARQIAGTLEA